MPAQRSAFAAIGAAVLAIVASVVAASHHPIHHHPKPSPVPVTTTTTVVVPLAGDCQMHGALPDPVCTPGATNPAVTDASMHTTICKKGWTATVRPPLSYTGPLKAKVMGAGGYTVSYAGQTWTDKGYNVTPNNPTDFELDHLIPLELGGAVADPHNLWPEPGGTAHFPLSISGQDDNSLAKDAFENYENLQVCSGKLALAKAQHDMATDWLSAYNAAGRPPDPYNHTGKAEA